MRTYKAEQHFLYPELFRASCRVLCLLSCFLILWGCATLSKKQDVLAIVDGEPITYEDLSYSLEVSHRREDLSSAGKLDISEYVQKLINDRLIMQEARRMGIYDYPAVREKTNAYILREAVTRLYNDEILQKVSVSEEEVRERFRRDHEFFSLGVITFKSREDAEAILERLRGGEDFNELAREHSAFYSKDKGQAVFKWKEMSPAFLTAVTALSEGEISEIVDADRYFHILKLIKRQDADEDEYEQAVKGIRSQIRKDKVAERSDKYLMELRAGADIEVAREIFGSLEPDIKGHSWGKWLNDKRVLVKVNDDELTVSEFVNILPFSKADIKETILENWIDIKVVDDEALSRGYELRPDLKGKLQRYENQVIKDAFMTKIVMKDIKVSKEEEKEYYLTHKDKFVKTSRYKIQQITLETMEDAQDVLKSLKGNTNFSWLAKKRSKDELAVRGGSAGWKREGELPAPVAEIIATLKPGEISPVLEMNGVFMIVRLLEKGGKEYKEFSAIESEIEQRLLRRKYSERYYEYIDKLRKGSDIKIFDDAVEEFQKIFRR